MEDATTYVVTDMTVRLFKKNRKLSLNTIL